MTTYAAAERAALADLLDRLGPDAPSGCEGWTTGDLAAHLVTREHDPLSVPGAVIPALAGLTEERMLRARDRLGYSGLVRAFRAGPAGAFALPGVDTQANLVEHFVHHEDVRRANGEAPRSLDPAMEDALWRATTRMAPLLLRSAGVPVVLERRDARGRAIERIRATGRPGTRAVRLSGRPSELALAVFGRERVADVELTGARPDVDAYLQARGCSRSGA